MDEFEDIIGYEGLYKINRKGEIYSCYYKKILDCYKRDTGYIKIGLTKNKKRKFTELHRLLAKQFIPNPNNYPFVDHIDENPENNNLENLRWIDVSGNQRNTHRKRKYDLPRGVYTRENINTYQSLIYFKGKHIHLGMFKTVEEASEAYENKFKELMEKYNI